MNTLLIKKIVKEELLKINEMRFNSKNMIPLSDFIYEYGNDLTGLKVYDNSNDEYVYIIDTSDINYKTVWCSDELNDNRGWDYKVSQLSVNLNDEETNEFIENTIGI
jgi:hypothetical protein